MFACLALALVASVLAEVHFKEDFDDGWDSRWTNSEFKGKDEGKFDTTAGKFFGDANNKGLHTTEDYRWYDISAKMSKAFNNKDKTFVLQYSVKHEQNLDCGGGYIKLLPAKSAKGDDFDAKKFGGDTEYSVMFGPDICGSSTRKVHVIFNYKGENYLIKKEIRPETDTLTHLYTLIVNTDNTYEVRIDNRKVQSGSLVEDWEMLPAKKIKDPEASKPEDWDEREKIPDPSDEKPANWDDVPKQIADPDAKKPDDWDDESDGEWEPPMIDNPDYKGEWKPKMISNPDYKGKWEAPEIDNPKFVDDPELYNRIQDAEYVGFELWQVKAGSIFDNILVTDSVEEAETAAAEVAKFQEGEKKAKDEADEAERKKREEERKAEEAKKAAEADDEDDDDEDEKKGDKKGEKKEEL